LVPSLIFHLIAGPYTPFSIPALHGAFKAVILAVVWSGAAVGIALKQLRLRGLGAVTGALYVSLGWVAIVAAPQFITLPVAATALLLAGAVLYTAGALASPRTRTA